MSLIPSSPCRVLIVEDDHAFAEVLGHFIGEQPGFEVVGAAASAEEALELCHLKKPTIALVDLGIPQANSGLQLIAAIKDIKPSPKVLVFSGTEIESAVQKSIRRGADGFLEKAAPLPSLLLALNAVRENKVYWGDHARRVICNIFQSGQYSTSPIQRNEGEVIRLLAQGNRVNDIARATGLSSSAVYKTLTRLRNRYNVPTNIDLTRSIPKKIWGGPQTSDLLKLKRKSETPFAPLPQGSAHPT